MIIIRLHYYTLVVLSSSKEVDSVSYWWLTGSGCIDTKGIDVRLGKRATGRIESVDWVKLLSFIHPILQVQHGTSNVMYRKHIRVNMNPPINTNWRAYTPILRSVSVSILICCCLISSLSCRSSMALGVIDAKIERSVYISTIYQMLKRSARNAGTTLLLIVATKHLSILSVK